MSDEFDDADSPHAREAIRRLNEAVPELPYPADFDFDFYDDISFQHYENVLGGWVTQLLEDESTDVSLLGRIFAFVEAMATSGDEHFEALIGAGFCEELACELPRRSVRLTARNLMGPRTRKLFDAEIEGHGWDDKWAEGYYGRDWWA